jgi:hypothetical protein
LFVVALLWKPLGGVERAKRTDFPTRKTTTIEGTLSRRAGYCQESLTARRSAISMVEKAIPLE